MARGKSENKKAPVKKTAASKNAKIFAPAPVASSTQQATPTTPLDLQQKCLNIFRDALKPGNEDDALLQEVKTHLFHRDFARAFGKDDYLRVYASRWSPSRALAYLQILNDIESSILAGQRNSLNVLCIGGGAGAEVVALGGWIHQHQSPAKVSEGDQLRNLQATFLDVAAWGTIVQKLHHEVVNPPQLSKYASAAAKEANVALTCPEAYTSRFEQADVLDLDDAKLAHLCESTDLVTLMFTLNELYSTSMPATQALLNHLTAHLQPGSHLLVVDSPGSYSTLSINGAEKKYPMQWLLDLTLLDSGKKGAGEGQWDKVVEDGSRWFRLPQGLRYPRDLENMRYQIHLYRRRGTEQRDDED